MKRILAFLSTVLLAAAFQVQAANWHVSISNGKNKNPGTPGAPLKNIWKAIEKAKPGDIILIAEGNYPGKMSCGWINLDKPVNLIGGYSPDFSARDVLKYRTMLRPTNAQNTTKPTHGTLTINTRKFGPNSNILIDGIIFDHTAANSYHPVKGKPAGFKDGMLTIPPAKGNTQYPSIDKYLIYAQTDGQLVIQNCLFLNGCSYAIIVAQYSGNVRILNNVFIGNRMMGADVAITISPSIKFMKVEDDGFDDLEDVEGMESVSKNSGLKDPALFKDVIDTNYLKAFLEATCTEQVDYDENSPINQFRAALGLNKQGKITTSVSMFANPYPFESAIRFFGAVKGFGAQTPAVP